MKCWHLPIVPGRRQPSIVGTSELNFRVRNGNGWTLTVINTNYGPAVGTDLQSARASGGHRNGIAGSGKLPAFPLGILVTRGGIEPPLSA